MSHWERLASGGVAAAAGSPANGHEAPSHSSSTPAPQVTPASLWECIYRNASPAQQRELLGLARRQGLLYSHQLPPLDNGNRSATDPPRQFLTRLLGGHVDELEPVHVPPLELLDNALDAGQREAVARALSTPDVCLIQGLPGTGKSRVVAEIVRQAITRGQRVLLLSSRPAALDRVLEMVGGQDAVCAVRCVGPEEGHEQLPPAVRPLTFENRVRDLGNSPLQQARQELAVVERRHADCRHRESLLPRLEDLALQSERLEQESKELEQRRLQLRVEVEKEAVQAETGHSVANPYASSVAALASKQREALASLDAAWAALLTRIEERQLEQAAQTTRLDALRPLADAKQQGRWWTGAWWRAMFQGGIAGKYAETEAARGQVADTLQRLGEEAQRLTRQREEAEAAFHAERARLIQAEVTRRRAELADPEAACSHALAGLREQWRAAWAEFSGGSKPAPTLTREAVEQTRQSLRRQQEDDGQRLSFARPWVACLEEFSATLGQRLPEYVNLLAATTSALPSDAHFGDAAPHGKGFDLLVWQEADQATESEFLNLTRRAPRWVLLGEGEAGGGSSRCDVGVTAVEPPPPRGAPRTPRGLVPSLRPGFFQRLWQHLHCDPRVLPYAWLQENDRLCCRLRPLAPDQAQWVERERVTDRPDIELRILTLPRAQPVLAEVVFPPSMPICQAKEYIYRELQELAVTAADHGVRWIEDTDRLVFQLADHQPSVDVLAVTLENGVREVVALRPARGSDGPGAALACYTCHLEFERGSGWDRARAEQWVRHHLGLRDLGRTAYLATAHRMHPRLAGLLSDWLFAGGYRPLVARTDFEDPGLPSHSPSSTSRCLAVNGSSPLVTFIPVPAAGGDYQARKHVDGERGGREHAHREAASPRPRPARGGAGLELDLSDWRHRDRLPPELRPLLPEAGLVNYLEAQAVVRALETLASDPAFRAAAHAWNGEPVKRPAVGVLALYHGQVELLRLLAGQNPALTASGMEMEFGTPEDFLEREALVVLLSLTRSHAHRAVAFGDGPSSLTLALTRAERKLVLFGDPGTLARRCQWEGPVDHLDAVAAANERKLIAHLVGYLHGQGPHQHVFQTCEGGA